MKLLPLLLLPIIAQGQSTINLSLSAKSWQMQAYNCYDGGDYCNSIRVSLLNDSEGDLYFTFPSAPANPTTATSWNTVNYLQTKYTQSLSSRTSLSMTVQTTIVSGAPQFIYTWDGDGNTCITPATARIIIIRKGDNGSGIGKYAYYRWWSNPISYELDSFGQMVVMTSLTPGDWSDVNGQFGTSDVEMFQQALSNPGYLGLTFGGGCFFGHGVDVAGGVAEFYLRGFQIQ